MAILKNDPIYPFKEGNYARPHHIIIGGSDEEISYELASLAKEKYDCTPNVNYLYVKPLQNPTGFGLE